MNSNRAPLILLGLLYVAFAACLAWSAGELPARVASHFDINGQPNGWMNRFTYLASMAAVGVVLPLAIVGVSLLIRRLPSRLVNLPHREYWLAPERRAETSAYMLRHSLWLACLLLILTTAIHYLAVDANRQAQPSMSNPPILGLMCVFLAGVIGWMVVLFRHFRQPPAGL